MDEDIVHNIIFLIGSLVVAIMILGMPVLLTLSFIFGWPAAIRAICAGATFGISLHDEYF